MSKQSHTPGPWHIDERDSHGVPHVTATRSVMWKAPFGSVYKVADVTYPTTVGETVGALERLANARLIAAAPDLLAACEAALNINDIYSSDTSKRLTDEVADKLRAAIAKAVGA